MKTKLGNTVKDTIWYSVDEIVFSSVHSLTWSLVDDSILTIVVDSVHNQVWISADSLVHGLVWDSIHNSTRKQINNFITQL